MKIHLPHRKTKYSPGAAVRMGMSAEWMMGMHLEICIGVHGFGTDGGPHG